jgi:hypothetical protein
MVNMVLQPRPPAIVAGGGFLGTAGEFLADASIVEYASVSGDMLTYNIS